MLCASCVLPGTRIAGDEQRLVQQERHVDRIDELIRQVARGMIEFRTKRYGLLRGRLDIAYLACVVHG